MSCAGGNLSKVPATLTWDGGEAFVELDFRKATGLSGDAPTF